jgi:hypothetical protein
MKNKPDLLGQTQCLPNGVRHVDLWIEINRLAEKHAKALPHDAEVFDALTFEFLNDLEKIDAQAWRTLCHGIGLTVYGAVAMSWCKGAQLADVWDDWTASGYAFAPGLYSDRPAHFVNPGLLPRETSLQRMAQISGASQLQLCAMIVASDGPIAFDLPLDSLKAAPPNIAAFLQDRLERQGPKSDDEQKLLSHWASSLAA